MRKNSKSCDQSKRPSKETRCAHERDKQSETEERVSDRRKEREKKREFLKNGKTNLKCNKTPTKRENRNRGHLKHFACALGLSATRISLDSFGVFEAREKTKQVQQSSVNVSAKRIVIAFEYRCSFFVALRPT